MSAYNSVSSPVVSGLKPFEVCIPDVKLKTLDQLLRLLPVVPEPSDAQGHDDSGNRGGATSAWLSEAKKALEKADWRVEEERLNSFPNYKIALEDQTHGETHNIHFIALFSTSPSAVPIVLLHSWIGSFVEFLPMLSRIMARFPDASELPYHVVVPSLPGYAFSSTPARDRNWTNEDNARLVNQLMVKLGLGAKQGRIGGYVAYGGGVHLVYDPLQHPLFAGTTSDEYDPESLAIIGNLSTDQSIIDDDAQEHGGIDLVDLAISSSPVSLLAWIGDRLLGWTDKKISLRMILLIVGLHWLTETFPSSSHGQRPPTDNMASIFEALITNSAKSGKPIAISYFAHVEPPRDNFHTIASNRLIWRKHHIGRGYLALERPEELLKDIEDFVGWLKAR